MNDSQPKPFDFAIAISQHVKSRARLRKYLKGEPLDEKIREMLVNDRKCAIGKLLYALQADFGHTKAWQKFEAIHQEYHQLVQVVISQYDSGETDTACLLVSEDLAIVVDMLRESGEVLTRSVLSALEGDENV